MFFVGFCHLSCYNQYEYCHNGRRLVLLLCGGLQLSLIHIFYFKQHLYSSLRGQCITQSFAEKIKATCSDKNADSGINKHLGVTVKPRSRFIHHSTPFGSALGKPKSQK